MSGKFMAAFSKAYFDFRFLLMMIQHKNLTRSRDDL